MYTLKQKRIARNCPKIGQITHRGPYADRQFSAKTDEASDTKSYRLGRRNGIFNLVPQVSVSSECANVIELSECIFFVWTRISVPRNKGPSLRFQPFAESVWLGFMHDPD